MKHVFRLLALVVLAAGGVAGYQAYRQHHTVAGLREALDESRAAFDDLATDYNQAVRQTAVTELIVVDDTLTVVVKTAFGDVEAIATPYDPRREIYLDYVVIDGKVWARRVFDDLTPPGQGILIESRYGAIDWDAHADADYGKAIYRKLTPGRWAITVTGNGALGLEKVADDAEIELVEPPTVVKRFHAIERSAE
ncbi:MAG: hypothetical protein AAFY08_07470 [Planctomycetota bacterium]